MTTAVANALVTAYPTVGLPTISGYTDASGNVALPLVSSVNYTLKFTGTAIANITSFIPKNTIFTLYKLRNKGTNDISISEQKLSAGKSVAAYPQSFSVKPVTPSTGTWSPSGIFADATKSKTRLIMPTSDQSISYATTVAAQLYVVGGLLNISTYSRTADNNAYNPGTNSWTAKKSDTVARAFLAAAAVNSKYYAIGGSGPGSTLEAANHAYDPATDTWSNRLSDTTSRTAMPATEFDSLVYVIQGSQFHGTFIKDNHAYDPATNLWATKASDVANAFQAATTANSRIYVIAGKGSGLSKINHAYDPGTNTWSNNASDTTGRDGLGAGTVAGSIYATNGIIFTGPGSSGKVNHRYDTFTNSWHNQTSAPHSRTSIAARATGGIVYAIDGVEPQHPTIVLKTIDAFDPATNTWATKTSDLTAREGPAAAVL